MNAKTVVAFIPARQGSQRIPDKNIKPFFGKPLFVHTIEQARIADIFADIWFSSDSMDYLHMAEEYGVKILQRKFPTEPNSPDIDWITSLQKHIDKFHKRADYYAILRPTSPFRKPGTIVGAWEELSNNPDFDSLKALTDCHTNPYKVFEIVKHDDFRHRAVPLLTDWPNAFTYPTNVFAHRNFASQVGFLDICKWDNIEKYDTNFGDMIMPYKVNREEAWDLNTEFDWWIAEELVKSGRVKLV